MKHRAIKMVVSDLDGTLLNSEHLISAANCKAINTIRGQGIEFMIATGRHIHDVAKIISVIDRDIPLITSNGAMLHNAQGKLIFSHTLESVWAADLLRMSEDFMFHRNVYTEDEWYADAENERLLALHADTNFNYNIVDFASIKLEKVLKVFFVGENKELKTFAERISNKYGELLNITFSLDNTLEVMHGEVSKGSALTQLLSSRNISASETMAFGDNLNDLEMLTLVGHPVVMDNGHEDLKRQLSDFYTAGANIDHGVAYYLESYFNPS